MHFKKVLWIFSQTVLLSGLIISASVSLLASAIKQRPLNKNTEQIYKHSNFQNNLNNMQLVPIVISSSTFAIVRDELNGDRLYAWGENKTGNLGISNSNSVTTPQLSNFINLPPKAKINGIYGSNNFTAVIINGTELYLAGANDVGQLGNGTFSDPVNAFTRNAFISDLKKPITHIAVGSNHILVIVDQQLYAWGSNVSAQVGNGSNANVNLPTPITWIENPNFNGVFATATNSYAWIGNELYAWGKETMTGNGASALSPFYVFTPEKITTLPSGTITSFSASDTDQCLLVLDQTKLYAWGNNYKGQLGNGKTDFRMATAPQLVPLVLGSDEIIKQTYSSNYFSAIKVNNELWLTGNNDAGQLCNESLERQATFKKMRNYSPTDSTTYSLSKDLGTANTDGIVTLWGANLAGNFGNGQQTSQNSKPVIFAGFGTPWVAKNKDNAHILASTALTSFYNNEIFNFAALTQYIELQQFASDTIFQLAPNTIPSANDLTQTITLSLLPNQDYYAQPDGAKQLANTPFSLMVSGFATTLEPTPTPPPINPEPIPPPLNPGGDEAFAWWWILVGIGGSILIALIIIIIIKRQKAKQI